MRHEAREARTQQRERDRNLSVFDWTELQDREGNEAEAEMNLGSTLSSHQTPHGLNERELEPITLSIRLCR